jgi:DNA-directed RNA polymerase specialized sigma24 family protein
MSVEDIANATGVTRETAKSRLRYAMSKLRKGMQEWR